MEWQRDRFDTSTIRDADSVRVMPGVQFSPDAVIVGRVAMGFRQFTPRASVLAGFGGLVGSANVSYTMLNVTTFSVEATRDVMYSFEPATPYYLVTSGRVTLSQRIGGPYDVIALAGQDRLRVSGRGSVAGRRTGRSNPDRGRRSRLPHQPFTAARAHLRSHRAGVEHTRSPRIRAAARVRLGDLRAVTMLASLLSALLSIGLQQAPAPAPGSTNANYVVGPQDVLTVTVFNEPQLSGRFRIENDGQFNYPFLGRIQAGGTTVAEIAAVVKSRLADGYLRDPQVTVDVEQFRSQNVFVMGEVRAPGRYTLTGSVTLVEALAQAGSTAATAGTEILILRPKKPAKGSPTLPEDVDADVQRVNLRDIQAGTLSANVMIRDGDTIFVPRAERFYVTGHIRSPGAYVFEPNLTVLQAISLAGGLTDRGSNRRLRIIRNQKEFDAKLTDIVQPGDTIIVRQRWL